MNMDKPGNDPRTGGEGPATTFCNKMMIDSWKVMSNEVRYGVLTSSGYHRDRNSTLNQQILAAKGYIMSPNDWKNVEMTGYFKVNSFTDSTQNGLPHIEVSCSRGKKYK